MDQQCESCQQRAPDLKRCSRCCQVFYCSRTCQKKDWKSRHREICQNVVCSSISSTSTADTVTTVDLSKLQLSDPNNNASSKSTMDIDRAKKETRAKFLGYSILDKFDNIAVTSGSMRVLLALISKEHPYPFRHCVYLQDTTGQEMFVAFYLDHDDPSPYFRWQDVVPGNYLCLTNPFIHYFMDGTVGLRIDEPCTITVLRF